MAQPQQPDPEPPRPPGAGDAADRDVDLPMEPEEGRQVPGNEDVAPDTAAPEPPD